MAPLGTLFFVDTDNVRYFIFLSNTNVEIDREKHWKWNIDTYV
jgi:hypothetical protein